jgi:1,4-dihydroxy-2-naphthoate octaprenyltransferase
VGLAVPRELLDGPQIPTMRPGPLPTGPAMTTSATSPAATPHQAATLANLPRWKIWVLASRPATMTAAVSPLLVGGALAWVGDQFAPVAWVAALLGACFIQLGTNYANDVFDYEKGADTADRKGPLRVTQAGLVSPAAVKRAMVLAFALSVVCGALLVGIGGWPIVWLGLASIASGIVYTGGPAPLGYLGLGDVFVFAFFGIAAVCGTFYVQTLQWSPEALLWSIPVGCTCTAVLVVNNLRDADTDVRVGKRTLAVRFGKTAVRIEYAVLWLIALGLPVALAAARQQPWLALPALLVVPAVGLTQEIWRTDDGMRLNAALARTAKLHLVLGVLCAAGLVLAGRP